MKFFKPLRYLLLSILLLALLYFLTANILSQFPKQFPIPKKPTEHIYIYYDEMHTDIIIDLHCANYPWEKLLPEIIQEPYRGYLGFGWGDKRTYLTTPTWDKLQPIVALKALFVNTDSLIHINYYREIKRADNLMMIKVTQKQHQKIEKLILKSFGAKPLLVAQGYRREDAFYASIYHYNLFRTCNTWTGDILRESNITMSYWTPLSSNVITSLQSYLTALPKSHIGIKIPSAIKSTNPAIKKSIIGSI
jgi:uncharacterized protein (TIGR02117 family)